MEVSIFNKYLNSITSLESHEQLLGITVSMFPHMKQNDRNNTFNKIKKRLSDGIKKTVSLASWDSLKVVRRG